MNRHIQNRERGVAMFMAMFALLLLSAIAFGLMFMADSETRINANYRSTQVAYYAARAGIEEVRPRLMTGQTASIAPPAGLPGATGGVVYVINAGASETVQPWSTGNRFFDEDLCHEWTSTAYGTRCTSVPTASNWYSTATSMDPGTSTAAAMDYKWTRITAKTNRTNAPTYVNGSSASGTLSTRICYNGANQELLPSASATCAAAGMNQVYVLTTLSTTREGTTRTMKAEVLRMSMPGFPAALTLTGPTPTYGAPNSNNFVVDGADACSVASPVVGLGVWDTAADTSVTGAIPNNRRDHYTGTGAWPDVSPVQSTMNTLFRTPAGVESLVQSVTSFADVIYSSDQTGVAIGSTASPRITVFNGNATFSGATTGAGIMVVRGTLSTSGNFSFDGIILVIGQGIWDSNGGGNGHVNGTVFMARSRNTSNAMLSNLGSVSMGWNGGGGNGIRYDSCAIANAQSKFPYQVSAMRMLP